jgi:S-phase kinase-associated protein 1
MNSYKALIIADNIKNKIVEFVLDFFNVQNNFTPEEEAELHKDKDRAFEDNNLMSCL